jgi:hypothetical protein
MSIEVTSNFTTDEYLIGLESPGTFGKATLGQQDQPFIYGLSPRFQVTNTDGKLFFREPRPQAVWKFDTEVTVLWAASGFAGGETVAVSIVDVNGTVIPIDAVEQSATGGSLKLTPQAAWGEGVISVRLVATTGASVVTQTVQLTAPSTYFVIDAPTRDTNWLVGQTVTIAWTAKHIDAAKPVQVFAVERTHQQTIVVADSVSAGAGTVEWKVPDSIVFTSSGWQIEIAPMATGVRSSSAMFQITAPLPTDLCTTTKLKKENYLHDEIVCVKQPFLILAGTLRLVEIKFEWLWCLDDRLRINATYIGANGARASAMSTKKIGPDSSKLFAVLTADTHGADLQVELADIRRTDNGTSSKSLGGKLSLLPYDAIGNPERNAGTVLLAAAKLETTDPQCKCPYEDPGATCTARISPPCVDPDAIQCDKPCETNDIREKCTDNRFPRMSRFANGAAVCSAGTSINIHATPCGNNIMGSIQSRSTQLTVTNILEQPSCDKFWLSVSSAAGSGWIITTSVELCPAAQFSAPMGTAGADAMTASFVIAALAAARSLLF